MIQDHNVFLVILSIIIAIVASYSALSITVKIPISIGKMRIFWLISGSFVMGVGVWSMHFVGMIAHYSHASVQYNHTITLASMAISIIASFIAFILTLSRRVKRYNIFSAGLIMGSGIALMHYLGMEAMIIEGGITYHTGLVILSIVIAFTASYLALFLFVRFMNHPQVTWLKWMAAIIMGIAVSGMHYTGMTATTFELEHTNPVDQLSHIDLPLLFSVIFAISIILLISWSTIFFERYVLEKMAYRDPITGLANRNELIRLFNRFDSNKVMSFLFIDLDQFKSVNDTLGHEAGDELLEKIGRIFKEHDYQLSKAFRIGGDEFLIVINSRDQKIAIRSAEKLIERLKQPFIIRNKQVYITGSIGIATGSIEKSDYAKLLRAADTAMYSAKQNGKNQYCIYTEEMAQQDRRKEELENGIQSALKEEQFYLEYQPQWNLKTDRLVGFESLARWNHPTLGTILPTEFIPIIKETGFIIPFTKWTLNEACTHAQILQNHGIEKSISINLSSRSFQANQLYDLIVTRLDQFKLDPKYLEIEVSELMMLNNLEETISQLEKIHDLGINIAIDDFGMGYSSIGLFEKLPIQTVKLDRTLIAEIANPNKQALIKSIIILAEALNLDVIAEGVEDERDIEYLTEFGCYLMQGFYFSKSMKFEKIIDWEKQNHLVISSIH